MLNWMRSVILALAIAPALLMIPPLPQSADSAQPPVAVTPRAVSVPNCDRSGWPYIGDCGAQSASSEQPRRIALDRIPAR
jgi:hypothetical protein